MSQEELKLGTRIKQICVDRGISLRQCERESDVKERTITRWDTNIPSFDKVVRVAQFLGMSIDELVYGKKKTATISDDGEFLEMINQLNISENRKQLLRDALLVSDETAALVWPLLESLVSDSSVLDDQE